MGMLNVLQNSPWFTTTNKYIKYHIELKEDYVNVKNNSSTVTIRVYIYRTNTGYTTWGPGTLYVKVDGTLYTYKITPDHKITHLGIGLMSQTFNIPHAYPSGVKVVEVSAWISHSQFSSKEQSHHFRLTTINNPKPVPKPDPMVPSKTPGPSSATWYTDWFLTNSIYKYRIEVTYHGYNVDRNTSNITVRIFVYRTFVGHTDRSGIAYSRIDGKVYRDVIHTGTRIDHHGRYVLDVNVDIPHNADGSKTIWVSGWIDHTCFYKSEHGFAIVLPSIPRRTTIDSITGGTIGQNMTVNLRKASRSFTTSAWLHVNGCNWQCVAWKDSSSSLTFRIPRELANHITNNTTATGKLVIRTYHGDKELGDDVWSVNLIVPEDMKIRISDIELKSDTLLDGKQMWIKGKSKLGVNLTIDSSDAYGAYISQYNVTFNGNTYSSKNFWSPVINKAGNLDLVATVIDSRGRSHIVTKTIYVEDYQSPKIEILAYRCNEYGIKEEEGRFVKIAYAASCSPLNGRNSFNINLDYKELGACKHETILSSKTDLYLPHKKFNIDMNPEKAYEIRGIIEDNFEKTEYVDKIPAAFILLDFKEGGTGIGIGKISSKNHTLDLAMDIDLYPSVDDQDERNIGYAGEPIYLSFNEQIKCLHNINGDAWRVNNDGTLFLKSGYTTSDERVKYNIDEFTNWDEYYDFYMSLKPKTFKYNYDLKEKTHIGFIAQDVADSIVDSNLMNDNLSIVNCEENDAMDDGREYSLSYQELIALNVKMIQKHEEEIKELKNKLDNLPQ